MIRKVQIPVVGGIRKTVTIPASGTTITEFGSGSVSLAQLKAALGITTTTTTGGGSTNPGTPSASIALGPGLKGGGPLTGSVPIILQVPIPAFIFDDGGSGGDDGPPGPPGGKGLNGNNGAMGQMGAILQIEPDAPDDPLMIPGNPGIRGLNGANGAAGQNGPIFFIDPDAPDDPIPVPGNPGLVGARGPAGPAGAVIWLEPDAPDDPPMIQGRAGTGGGGSALTLTDGTHTVLSVAQITVTGGTVGGTSPNATLSISGGGGGVPGPAGIATGLLYWFQGDLLTGTSGSLVTRMDNNAVTGPIVVADSTSATSGGTVHTSALNSLPALDLPGSSTGRYPVGPVAFGTLKKSTVFVVFLCSAVSSANVMLGGNSGAYQLAVDGGSHLNLTSALVLSLANNTTTLVNNTWYQGNLTFDSNTGAYAFRLGRAADGSGTATANDITSPTQGLGYNVGSGSQDYAGTLAEVIVYNRVLSSSEITLVENYLNAKWGV